MQVQYERWTCASEHKVCSEIHQCTVAVTRQVSGALGLKAQPEVRDRNKPHTKKDTRRRTMRDREEHLCAEISNPVILFCLQKPGQLEPSILRR